MKQVIEERGREEQKYLIWENLLPVKMEELYDNKIASMEIKDLQEARTRCR